MNEQRDILSEPWKFGILNRSILKLIAIIDCALFVLGLALFIRNLVISGVLGFLAVDFLQLLASCFQCLLGLMTIRKWRFNYSRAFLRHYIKMKIVYLIFFGTENAVYVPLVCRDDQFEEENEYICGYMEIGPAVLIVWFLFQSILLGVLRQISYKSSQEGQRRIILENIYQSPAVPETTQDEPKGLVVEFNGIPFSLVNSGPVPFKIMETTQLKKKTSKVAQRNVLEQVDIRYLIMANNISARERVEKKDRDQITKECDTENQKKPVKSRRFDDIPEDNNTKQTFRIDQIEEKNKTRSFATDILTRNK